MHDCARGCDRLRHLPAAETIERFYLKMLAQGEARVLWQEPRSCSYSIA